MMKNPRYANDQGGILLDYDEAGLPSLYVSEDSSPLWAQAVAGDFGPIEPYVAPPDPTPAEIEALLASEARAIRNRLLTASDWTQVADAPVDQAAWAAYRQALRDVPSQPGFPATIDWPAAPS